MKHITTNQNLAVGWGSFKAITAAQKASEKVTDYCNNVIYENGALKMILTPEGYITLSGTTPTYHYYLRDHLGNNRVVVNQSGTTTQVNHYYPFGGVFGEGTATTDQPYKYNDKELDRTNGLDLYDFRPGIWMRQWGSLRLWTRWQRSIIPSVRMRMCYKA